MAKDTDDQAREESQNATIEESEALKDLLAAHAVRLEEYVAALRRRTPSTGNGSNGRVD